MKKNALILVLLLSIVPVLGQKSAFTLDDIYKIKGVGAPVLSPDGNKLAYTITEYTLKGGKSKSAIHLYDLKTGTDSCLDIDTKNVNSPFWSNDPDKLYYQKVIYDNNQVFEYVLSSREKRQITDYFNGVSDVILSPDGLKLAFTSMVYADCNGDAECNKRNIEAADKGPVQAYMTDDLLFRHWTSYSEGRVNHIFIQDLVSGTIKDVTPFNYNCPVFSVSGGGRFVFSPDSRKLCYVANPDERKANSTNADLWLLDLMTGELKNITAGNPAWDGSPEFSPDGRYIAYRRQDQPGYESDCFRLALYNLSEKKSEVITRGFEDWIDDFVWSPDSKSIYFEAQVKSFSPVYSIDIQERKIIKRSEDRAFSAMEISPDGKSIYCIGRLMNQPSEIFKISTQKIETVMLSRINTGLTEKVDFRAPEKMWINGAGGEKVHVLLVLPHDFDPAKKYPLIVNVHGGPQSQWMDAYRPDAQLYAGAGYITAFPNPHGSTGYGQPYTAAISGDWGGRVYEDVMMVTDSLEKLPYVDQNRIGAMGWSFGGYMMNWLQGHTKRFKCLVSMMGLYNLESFYGTTEELWFPEWDVKGAPWEQGDLYKKFSPHNYVNNFSTPTLIITGEKDFRVSYTQSMEYFTALKKKGIDSRLIIFKNDGHWPSSIKSMPLYYNAHLEWFHKYLGGLPAPYNSEKLVRNTEELK